MQTAWATFVISALLITLTTPIVMAFVTVTITRPEVVNPEQADSDEDGLGDLCDIGTDSDDDGYSDSDELHFGSDPYSGDSVIYDGGWPYNADKDDAYDPGWDAGMQADDGDRFPRWTAEDQSAKQ